MLEFIKKIFRNEEQEAKKITEISLHNLEEWTKEKAKPLMEEINRQIEVILMKVNEELERARFNVEVLENAKLQNPNIPFKAKQYMEGNRKAYIRSINSFLGHMEINNKDYYYLADFCKLFDELLNDLNNGTLRSYTILQEFFANEASKLAQNLKNFDDIFKELKSVIKSKKIVAMNNAIEKIENLETKTKQKINLNVDFKSAEVELKLANDSKNSIMQDIENFNKSDEHNSFLRLNEEKKNKISAFYQDENQILQSFSVLERPLRKYSHVAFEHEEIVLDYLKQPIETIINDKELAILEILKNLKKMLEGGELQVDDKKKEKSLEEIKKLGKEFIEEFRRKYFSYQEEIQAIERMIAASGVAEKFKEFNKQLEEINLRIEKGNEEIKKFKDDIIKVELSVQNLRSDIENSLKDMFNEDIKVNL